MNPGANLWSALVMWPLEGIAGPILISGRWLRVNLFASPGRTWEAWRKI